MNSTTLRGVFPEPKPVYKRNFIKENVRHIKRMQGLVQNSDSSENQKVKLYRPPVKVVSLNRRLDTERALSRSAQGPRVVPKVTTTIVKKKGFDVDKAKGDSRKVLKEAVVSRAGIPPSDAISLVHRGVQTDTAEDIQKLYETGVIRYPNPALLKALSNRKSPRKPEKIASQSGPRDRGDPGLVAASVHREDTLNENMQNLDLKADNHDYIKENIVAIRNRTNKIEPPKQKSPPPKGVIPKYLRDRKELKEEFEKEIDCPLGHVLLPDEERKETLRVLRQSYADRIQELNSMPVRNDTLRMRNRKMAIEEELKKIDEGIKVFQRPKVFVKVNA